MAAEEVFFEINDTPIFHSKKRELAYLAQKHTAEMAFLYEEEIAECIANSTIYRDGTKFRELVEAIETNPKIVPIQFTFNGETTEAIFTDFTIREKNILDGMGKVAVLNFASFKNAGGGYLKGAHAQEESLCEASYLYNVLSAFEKEYYVVNRGYVNDSLYTNAALYTPNVRFFQKKNGVQTSCRVDVITCAAPNLAAYNKYHNGHMVPATLTFEDRIEFLRAVVDLNQIDTLILGAWGCGAFGWNPGMVSSLLHPILDKSNCRAICYAVPKWKGRENYYAFINTFNTSIVRERYRYLIDPETLKYAADQSVFRRSWVPAPSEPIIITRS